MLREEHVPRVFEKRVLKRISGAKRDEEWRLVGCYAGLLTIPHKKLHRVYSSLEFNPGRHS
jgi:hypothetical protein